MIYFTVAMEPSNATCALLVKDTKVEILPSAPPSYNKSTTTPVAEYTPTSSSFSTLWNSIFGNQNSNSKRAFDSGYSSGSSSSGSGGSYSSGASGGTESGYDSGISGSSTSGNGNNELTSPVSATSTPSSISPVHWDIGTSVIGWLYPHASKVTVDMQGSTVDPLPVKESGTTIDPPTASVRGGHKKQKSLPIKLPEKLLPENIDTPPLNVILRVQPYVGTAFNDIEQLDVYVHPSTFPTLYMRRHIGQEASSTGYLVKLQTVTFPEKPNKKHAKSEQDDENLSTSQSSPVEDKGVVKALVVRLCFASFYHISSNKESSTDVLNIKPNHIVVSDIVRQQLGIKDFSRVRLTEVTNSMRIPCNGHSIELTPLDDKVRT